MIKIKEVSIYNYKSCIKTSFIINNNLSAFIGVNGAGKSNILTSLLLLKNVTNRHFYKTDLHDEDKFLKTRLDLSLDIDEIVYNLKSDFVVDIDENNNDVVKFSNLRFRNITNKEKFKSLNEEVIDVYKYLEPRTSNPHYQRMSKDLLGRLNLSEEVISFHFKLIEYVSNINYYSATQFSNPKNCPTSIDLDNYRLLSSRKRSSHERFIYDLYTSYKDGKKLYKKFINMVGGLGLELIENIKFYEHTIPNSQFKVKSGGKIEKIDTLRKIIVPSFIIDSLNLSPNQLSEGTFKTLALIFYILKDNSNLLIIEEPEVCVHHGLLNSIIELIKFESKNKQIFVSTHSDYILDKLKPENVILVDKSKIKGTTAYPLLESFSNDSMNDLKEYLDSSGNLGEYWKETGFDI
ncbi:AAA family ATPase [Epilithonimonas caeni]|uniref:AAA family ATPase n=1 Tax=Epilithonimonas caeni TaxID=365343 RepID=UPI000427820B|nr:ATP-binding protein [Epilithonimonas caeni]